MASPTSSVPASDTTRLATALEGCLLGTAAGDTVGLPYEHLSRRSVAKLLTLPLEQDLLLGRGMPSDDTEHSVMLALSLLEAGSNLAVFKQRLAARMRWWLLAFPPGVGSATARAILKLWANVKPADSGVFSAGNGPSMRSALLGVVWAHEPARLRDFVWASTRMTHSDPKAYEAALAVAVAAGCAMQLGATDPKTACKAFLERYLQVSSAPQVLEAEMALLSQATEQNAELAGFVRMLGCEKGVTGYSLHTVPAALYAWMRHSGDFRQAVTAIVQCGGDTDSTAAITGAIVGAGLGPQGIPPTWLSRIVEWPRGVTWMRKLSQRLAQSVVTGKSRPATRLSRLTELLALPWTLLRNLAMVCVVLYVLVRRLAGLLLAR